MNTRTLLRVAGFVPLLILSNLLAACSSKEGQAQEALSAYQAAAAAGDLQGARQALATLVAVDEDNAEYWVELGQLHAQAGAFNDAFYAFGRAHELDRGNANVLQALTQLALRGGALEQAEDYAQQLELLSPADPAVKLTNGYVALRRGDAESAGRYADQLLALSPYDSAARVLKARALLRQNKGEEAIALLEEQARLQPSDGASLRALFGLLQRRDDWARMVVYGRRLLALVPDDPKLARDVIEAALRTGDVPTARQLTLEKLEENLTSGQATELLNVWAELRPDSAFNADVQRLAAAAPNDRKLVLASFLNRVGDARAAVTLTQPLATLPVTAENTTANAIYAAAVSQLGQRKAASDRLNQVLSLDPGHIEALRARTQLALALRLPNRATKDAQRLVSVSPADAASWILLARVHAAIGNQEEAGRTLWNGFHQISANRNIYEALRVYVARTQGAEGARRVDQEFADQRDALMAREFV